MEAMVVDSHFWNGRKVYVTGYTGFKGSWLLLVLQRFNAVVSGLSLDPPTSPSLFNLAFPKVGMNLKKGDVRELDDVVLSMQGAQPEIVIHFAAQSLVRKSYAEPIETFSTNVMGTANVLEAARRTSSVKAVLIVTTDKCYENKNWSWGYREIDELGGHDPYSASKACAELVTRSYRDSFLKGKKELYVASARAGNVIGGGDWSEDRLVPDAVRAFSKRQPLFIRNPSAVRPWQHVLEPLSGYLMLCQKLVTDGERFAEAWNFGPDRDGFRNVEWIADQIVHHWGKGAAWKKVSEKGQSEPAPHEATLLSLDCAKARTQLRWSPRWDIARSIEETAKWYKRYYRSHESALEFSREQIDEYFLHELEGIGEVHTHRSRRKA